MTEITKKYHPLKKLVHYRQYPAFLQQASLIRLGVVAVHYAFNELGYSRLGVIVSKKAAGNNVNRNRIKRVLKEWFRVNQDRLGGHDVIVVAKAPVREATNLNIRSVLESRFLPALGGPSAKSRFIDPELTKPSG